MPTEQTDIGGTGVPATSAMRTPVLFLIFNRPEVTRAVFEALREAEPPRLYVAADGPRANRPRDRIKCAETREVISLIDWPCDVHTLFRDSNLGCGRAVSSAIDWFFSHESEGIIIEDDCLPERSFFFFCEELLARYRHDERIMSVSGTDFSPSDGQSLAYSYRFSRYSLMWGWATWRRAWKAYDYSMTRWPSLRKTGWLREIGAGSRRFELVWRDLFDRTHAGKIDTWDFQWIYSSWLQNGLSIIPATNLIANLGFGKDATHLPSEQDPRAHLPTRPISFPLDHPSFVYREASLDRFLDRYWWQVSSSRATPLALRDIDERFFGGRLQSSLHYLRSIVRQLDRRLLGGAIRRIVRALRRLQRELIN